jgi:hypothetical protein
MAMATGAVVTMDLNVWNARLEAEVVHKAL